VDDFGVKYIGKEHADHLIKAIEKYQLIPGDGYEVEVDWVGDLLCGITLDWHYSIGDPSNTKGRYLVISLYKYMQKIFKKFKHRHPKNPSTALIVCHTISMEQLPKT
jgi:hypothetical protein